MARFLESSTNLVVVMDWSVSEKTPPVEDMMSMVVLLRRKDRRVLKVHYNVARKNGGMALGMCMRDWAVNGDLKAG